MISPRRPKVAIRGAIAEEQPGFWLVMYEDGVVAKYPEQAAVERGSRRRTPASHS